MAYFVDGFRNPFVEIIFVKLLVEQRFRVCPRFLTKFAYQEIVIALSCDSHFTGRICSYNLFLQKHFPESVLMIIS